MCVLPVVFCSKVLEYDTSINGRMGDRLETIWQWPALLPWLCSCVGRKKNSVSINQSNTAVINESDTGIKYFEVAINQFDVHPMFLALLFHTWYDT